ncbi:MAG: DUF58 domain-containing protein [Planctomycetes bacterium]|nr:DUF58 domain-containing protein [Planctomycetota bacterium]
MSTASAEKSAGQRWQPFEPDVLAALGGLDLKARYVVEGYLAGLHRSPFHGFSVEFSEYRDYQPGDDLRHLDWRLFARSDRLCVKKYIQETNVRFYLVCDASPSMAYRGAAAWGSKLDVARVVGAAIVWLMLRQNDAAGMLTAHGLRGELEFIRPSQKPSQLGELLRRLDLLRPAPDARLAVLLEHAQRLFHRRSLLVILTDLLESPDQLDEPLKQLRFQGHECLVFQILDRDELEFPFDRPSVFEDLESGARRKVDPRAARVRYLERFGAFMDDHRERLRSMGIPYCLIRTDSSPWPALSAFLAERGRRP